MSDDLAQRIINCIAETQHLEAGKIGIDSTFEELGIDSLDGINILFALETEFDISIPDDAAQEIRTVREMVNGVTKLIEEKASADSAAQA
jgi:acyl carrier protein